MDGLAMALSLVMAFAVAAFVIGFVTSYREARERRRYRATERIRPWRKALEGGLYFMGLALMMLVIPMAIVALALGIAELLGGLNIGG